nr:hypothetical protein [uncultured bacterium]
MDIQESYIERICETMQYANFHEYDEILNELSELQSEEATIILMRAFLRYYRAQKADFIATFMERAIRFNPEWALIENPNNPLFRVALISGSKDIYDCYVEEVHGLDQEWYKTALQLAMAYNERLLDQCQPVLIGCHYNTGLMQNGRKSLDMEDYEVMDATIVKYNQIVGMRQILKDLIIKSGIQFNG